MKKPKRGRPPGDPADRRDHWLHIRVTEKEHAAIEKVAGKGLVNEWARTILLENVKGGDK